MIEEATSLTPSQPDSNQTAKVSEDESLLKEESYISESTPLTLSSIYLSIKEASSNSRNQSFIRIFTPVLFIVWWFPILFLGRFVKNMKGQLAVKSFPREDFVIRGPETIWTTANQAFQGRRPMRFFGIRFMAIWVLPFAITIIVIDFLFISPLTS